MRRTCRSKQNEEIKKFRHKNTQSLTHARRAQQLPPNYQTAQLTTMSDPLRQFFPNLPVGNPNQPYMGVPPGNPGLPFHFAQLSGHMSPMRMASPPPHMMQQPPTMQDARSIENLLKQSLGVDGSNSASHHHHPSNPPDSTPTPVHLQQAPSPQPQSPQSHSQNNSPALARSDSKKGSQRRKR